MMHEDRFPGFQLVYRQLRKEGMQFPPRDPNSRVLMSQLVNDSPMFDYVEQISNRTTPGASETPTPNGNPSGKEEAKKS